MAAFDFNWNPTGRQLRQFAVASLAGLPLIAYMVTGHPGLAAWQPVNTMAIGGAAAIGLLMAIVEWFKPGVLRPVFILACMLALPIGLVVSELILLIIYLLVFAPLALTFRIVGRDPLDRTIDRDRESYWQAKNVATGTRSYFRQS